MKEYYWDNSATTAMSKRAAERYCEVAVTQFGNPSSLHRRGIEAEKIIKGSRAYLASTLGAKDREIYFTSGGTEGNNLAIRGIARSYQRRGKHIVVSAVEHPAVLNTVGDLEKQGWEVTRVQPDSAGYVSSESVLKAVRPDTVLVSLMLVNNETGALMPCETLGNALKRDFPETVFHVDAVQGYGKIAIDVRRWKIDALTVSAHKLKGPKGVGFLYMKEGLRCEPLFTGGGQESGIRPGTENTAGIAAMEVAVRESETLRLETMAEYKQKFVEGLQNRNVEFVVNGSLEKDVPYILNLSFPGVRSEVLLHTLESKGIYISAGSACSSKKKSYSHVLSAMGLSEAYLESTIRFSWGEENLQESLEEALDIVAQSVSELSLIMKRRR